MGMLFLYLFGCVFISWWGSLVFPIYFFLLCRFASVCCCGCGCLVFCYFLRLGRGCRGAWVKIGGRSPLDRLDFDLHLNDKWHIEVRLVSGEQGGWACVPVCMLWCSPVLIYRPSSRIRDSKSVSLLKKLRRRIDADRISKPSAQE